LIRVVSKEQSGAGRLQAAQLFKHLQLSIAVKGVGRQGERLKRAPQVTGIPSSRRADGGVTSSRK
jgi:hypothetical protein